MASALLRICAAPATRRCDARPEVVAVLKVFVVAGVVVGEDRFRLAAVKLHRSDVGAFFGRGHLAAARPIGAEKFVAAQLRGIHVAGRVSRRRRVEHTEGEIVDPGIPIAAADQARLGRHQAGNARRLVGVLQGSVDVPGDPLALDLEPDDIADRNGADAQLVQIERGVDPRDDLKRAVFPANADVVVDVLHAQSDEGVRRSGGLLDRELDELVGRLETRRLQHGIGGVDDPEAVALDLKFGRDARQARPAGARLKVGIGAIEIIDEIRRRRNLGDFEDEGAPAGAGAPDRDVGRGENGRAPVSRCAAASSVTSTTVAMLVNVPGAVSRVVLIEACPAKAISAETPLVSSSVTAGR